MRLLLLCLPLALFIFLPDRANAQDEDKVIRDLVEKAQTSYNACNADAIIALYDPDSMIFADEGPLTNFDPQEIRSFCSNGGKYDFKFDVILARSHNETGVSLLYNRGTVTPPGGNPIPVNDRITVVWAYNGERWNVVHIHMSPM